MSYRVARDLLWQFAVLCPVCLVACPGRGAEAQEPAAREPCQESPHLVIVRLSDALLTGLFNRSIDVQIPVSDVILGTPVSGAARVVGQSHVELVPSQDAAKFAVVCKGTVYSRTDEKKDTQ